MLNTDPDLMSYHEYAQLQHSLPYCYDLRNSQSTLRYFGTPHVNTPGDPIFARIESEFISLEPDVVVIEGVDQLRREVPLETRARTLAGIAALSRDQSIRENGESLFTIQLALNKSAIFCPEPSFEREIAHVAAQGFNREDIFGYYVLRTIDYWFGIPDRPSLAEYVAPCIEDFKKNTDWDSFNYSLDQLDEISKRVFGCSLTKLGREALNPAVSPTVEVGAEVIIKTIARESATFRDRHIIKEICQIADDYRRIFVVYGYTHAVMQERALRAHFMRG